MCDGEEWAPRRVGAPDRVACTFPCRVRVLVLSGVPGREKQAEDRLPFLRDGQSGRGHLRKVQGGISHTLTTRGWFGHPSWLRAASERGNSIKSQGLNRCAWGTFLSPHSTAVWLWASCLTSLSLHVLICKMGTRTEASFRSCCYMYQRIAQRHVANY